MFGHGGSLQNRHIYSSYETPMSQYSESALKERSVHETTSSITPVLTVGKCDIKGQISLTSCFYT